LAYDAPPQEGCLASPSPGTSVSGSLWDDGRAVALENASKGLKSAIPDDDEEDVGPWESSDAASAAAGKWRAAACRYRYATSDGSPYGEEELLLFPPPFPPFAGLNAEDRPLAVTVVATDPASLERDSRDDDLGAVTISVRYVTGSRSKDGMLPPPPPMPPTDSDAPPSRADAEAGSLLEESCIVVVW
jgi:hypothetical protein